METTLVLIDGENILLRYQSMVADGKTPVSNVTHKENAYLWHPNISKYWIANIFRISYYTTVVGDDKAIEKISSEIASIKYNFQPGPEQNIMGAGTLNPHVYKKARRGAKTKSVDINLTIDALRHAYRKDVEKISIFSGDGDYLPLIEEIKRHGVCVSVYAFSAGCNLALTYVADEFHELDEWFFQN